MEEQDTLYKKSTAVFARILLYLHNTPIILQARCPAIVGIGKTPQSLNSRNVLFLPRATEVLKCFKFYVRIWYRENEQNNLSDGLFHGVYEVVTWSFFGITCHPIATKGGLRLMKVNSH